MDSKFKGMLKPKPPAAEPIPDDPENGPSSAAPKRRGRPTKRAALYNNPDYYPTNFFVHVNNYADAQARLRKERSGKSMSDLVNELIANWLSTSEK